MSSVKEPKFSIAPAPDGPYMVKGLEEFSDSNGPIEIKKTMALCRCGESANKPFCDGKHAKIGFSSAKLEDRVEDKWDDYQGAAITIHDNRGICAHCGRCTDALPSVFRYKQDPWIEAGAAGRDEIIAAVLQCPSGSLKCSVEDLLQPDHEGRTPAIFVAPNGPYVVTGEPALHDTRHADGASTEHYALCRCGGSKNKPFCDGAHWSRKFTDEEN